MGKCGPEKTLYLDTFDAVVITNFVGLFVYRFLKNAHQKIFFFHRHFFPVLQWISCLYEMGQLGVQLE